MKRKFQNGQEESLQGYKITGRGIIALHRSMGHSSNQRIEKFIMWEFFATDGHNRDYIRSRRANIVKLLISTISFKNLVSEMRNNGFQDPEDIFLSDIDGLYTANPATDSTATLIHEVSVITDETYEIAGGAGSSMGTGGMYTKIKAAHMATNSGIHMIIASGESDNSLRKVCKGENIGTLFVANDQGVSQKHHWVAYGKRLSGSITIDEGCTKAVLNHGARGKHFTSWYY